MSAKRVFTSGADEAQHRFVIADALNRAIRGNLDAVGTFTLAAGVTTTTVTDNLFYFDQVVVWSPTTANAAAALAGLYISARANGSFTLTHANTGTTDRTFFYVRLG